MLSPWGDPLLLWKLSVSTSLTFISKNVLLRRLTYQCSYEKRMTYWCSLYALGTLLFEFLQLFTNGAIQYHLYNDMSEKEILINNLTGKFNKERRKRQFTGRIHPARGGSFPGELLAVDNHKFKLFKIKLLIKKCLFITCPSSYFKITVSPVEFGFRVPESTFQSCHYILEILEKVYQHNLSSFHRFMVV